MPEPNSDQIALVAQADLHRLVVKVIAPALSELQPVAVSDTGGEVGEETFFATAAAVTHNALCQEARKAFALIIGATFERHVRLWLAQGERVQAEQIQRANFDKLFDLVSEMKGVSLNTLPVAKDLAELWEVVSAIRHGDGRATEKLAQIAPQLCTASSGAASDIRFSTLNIGDADLNRYYLATASFWGAAGATPPLGI